MSSLHRAGNMLVGNHRQPGKFAQSRDGARMRVAGKSGLTCVGERKSNSRTDANSDCLRCAAPWSQASRGPYGHSEGPQHSDDGRDHCG